MFVARALDGDVEAFTILFRRHAADVHRFAQRRTRSVDLADDVVSVAFEKGWRALGQLGVEHGDRFRPWVFRIAANEMASVMRSAARRNRREHLAALRGEVRTDVDQSDPIARAVEFDADKHEVLTALSALSERHQEVISLRYLADLSAAETAVALGISRGNVAVLLHRALGALRKNMEAES